VLILDEIQAGVGRTGKFWGHQHSTITPDVILTAKGIASGFPISAMAASTELMNKAWAGSQGGTYGGNAVSAAAAVATLDVVRDENLVENSRVRGAELRAGLEALQADNPLMGDVRGLGLMQAVEFVTDDGQPNAQLAAAVQQAAIAENLLLLTCGTSGNVVRIIPALTVSTEEIASGVDRFGAALRAAQGA